MTPDQLGFAGYAGLSTVLGVGVGLMMVAILFHPGENRGPTQRLRHVLWSMLLVSFGFGFVFEGFSAPDPGTTVAEQRGLGFGLGVGYSCAAAWLARRRLRRAAEIRLAAEAVRRGAPPPGRPRPVWRRAARFGFRAVDYYIGVGMCAMVLIGGSLGGSHLQVWDRERGWSTLAVLATVHGAGFLYSQTVSSVATRALRTAVRDDWRIGRRGRFWLATGPCLFGAPMFLVLSPGAGVGLLAQLVALYIGFRHTHGEPAGLLATLKSYRRERAESRHPSVRSVAAAADPVSR